MMIPKSFPRLTSFRVLGLLVKIIAINASVEAKLIRPENIKIWVFIDLMKTGAIKAKKVKLMKK